MAEATPPKTLLGVGALLSIGIGGMIGGGIFAVTGLTIELTRGAAPLAFAVAGVVALLTAWSYLKLTLRYPSSGGTVEFLNRAFGPGVFTGALNILLCLSYIILLAIYAYAFGSYGAQLFGGSELARQTLASGVLIVLTALNFLGPHIVIRSENGLNILKLILLAGFIVVGLVLPGDPARIEPPQWVAPLPLISGAMIIFLNYEGFELIANAAPQAANPHRSLPIAYLGGVASVILVYMGIAAAVLLHLDFGAVAAHRDNVLSAAGRQMLGGYGAVAIIIAALAATASAINATFMARVGSPTSSRNTVNCPRSSNTISASSRPRGSHYSPCLPCCWLTSCRCRLSPPWAARDSCWCSPRSTWPICVLRKRPALAPRWRRLASPPA